MLAHSGTQQFGYWICAAAFLLAALVNAFSLLRRDQKWLLVTACATTSVWAATMALVASPVGRLTLAGTIEIIRDAIWIALLVSMLRVRSFARLLTGFASPAGLAAAAIGITAITVLAFHAGFGTGARSGAALLAYPELLLSIFVLALVENLYRNCDADGRWGIRTLCLGLSLLFGFDLVFYADALFAGRSDMSFLDGRGFVDALAVPLLLLSARRSRNWRREISISRDVVFRSAVLLGSGVYLLAMAALGTVLRLVGGSPALQMVFMTATVVALVVIFSSRSFRSTIRIYISKHFFKHKYDYREVWLNFIRDLSYREYSGNLQGRIVHAVADIFNCPAGALWVLQPDRETFAPSAQWNLGDDLPSEPADSSLADYLRTNRRVVDVNEYRRYPERYRGFQMQPWLKDHPRAWLLVPLIHNSMLYAFLILGTPRVAIDVTWEDLDLLKTIGEQAASYLAEEQASRALIEATRFEEFNRWAAFLVHDIKGIVGQMSLVVDNAEHHINDNAFQSDVIRTVASSVLRMRKLLGQLESGPRHEVSLTSRFDAAALLRQVGDRWRRSIPSLRIADGDQTMLVEAREDSLVSVLDHLIQNAFEASGPEGNIRLTLGWHGGEGMLEVQDNGPGMDPSFVREQLFKPLSSSKPNGFGLGAFQARQLVQAMGGRLEVDTSPGQGTTMRVRLPILEIGGTLRKKG